MIKLVELYQVNITLIRPPYSQVYLLLKESRKIKKKGIYAPLGILYIASVLKKAGHNVQIIDAEVEQLSIKEIINKIYNHKTKFVGITATTPEFKLASQIIKKIKEKVPGIITCIGGVHATIRPKETLEENPHIDLVVRGEGELTIIELIEAIEEKKELVNIPGITYKDETEIRSNSDRPVVENIDDIPFPAVGLVDYSKYLYHVPKEGIQPIANIITSRGCPFKCNYCYHLFPHKVRYRSIENILDEIQFMKEHYGINFFLFCDETFTINRKRVLALCDSIIERELNIGWFCQTRCDTTELELLEKMKEAGCKKISMGVESGNQKILDIINKGTNLDQYRKAYNLAKRVGIETRASFMIGLPYDTIDTIRETINFAKELDIMEAYFNIAIPFPGTELHTMASRGEGLKLLTTDWSEYKRWGNAVTELEDLSREDLIKLQKQAIIEFFARPIIIWNYLKKFLSGEFSLYYYQPLFYGLKHYLLWKIIGKL